MNQAVSPSEHFDPELNVSREEILNQIETYLNDIGPSTRLISLVGAAGSGKSWLMSDLYRRLRARSDHVLWLNLAESGRHPQTGDPLPNCRTADGRSAWLQQTINQTNQALGEEIVQYNAALPFTNMFSAYVQRACSHPRRAALFLLVDGFDELESENNLDFWQEQVFATFWQGECTNLLLARRDEQLLSHPLLSWNEEIIFLSGFSPAERESQIALRSRRAGVNPDLLQTVLGDHLTASPFLNTCLFEKATAKEIPSIAQDDIEACLELFMQRAGLGTEPTALLRSLARELPLEWTLLDLRQLSPPIRLDDPDMADLFQSGIVQQIKGTSFYSLDDGVYQLLNTAASPAEEVQEYPHE